MVAYVNFFAQRIEEMEEVNATLEKLLEDSRKGWSKTFLNMDDDIEFKLQDYRVRKTFNNRLTWRLYFCSIIAFP